MIFMDNVTKIYKINSKKQIYAVKNLNLNIQKGEAVGYIGTNGAGKSTTIKMLTGIIKPSSGSLQVANFYPVEDRKKLAKKIGVVFGQRTQLLWDLPPEDSFFLHSKIYKIQKVEYRRRLEQLVEDFNARDFINRPTRQLSLGQRVTCDIILSLLHNPELIFLDEPTIGLDIFNKEKIRSQLVKINKNYNTTVFLTSHDLSDVEQVCKRIVIMRQGEKIYDDSISNLKKLYSDWTEITVLYKDRIDISLFKDYSCFITEKKDNYITFSFLKSEVSINELINFLYLQPVEISDISINQISLEKIIKKVAKN